MIMFALEEELSNPLRSNEGPIGLVLCPSRELARQTYEIMLFFFECLAKCKEHSYPLLRGMLCIGGENSAQQLSVMRSLGTHCIIATPG